MKFRINFLVRPSKVLKSGLINLECCITVNGGRFYIRLPRQLRASEWNQEKQKVKGKSEEAIEINNFIEAYKQNLYVLQSKIIQLGLPYNVVTFKNALNGKLDKTKTLFQLYEEHNAEFKILRDKKQIASATYQKHTTTVLHLKKYLKEKYKRDDINLIEINKSFIEAFHNYLKINLKIQHNSSLNYMKNFKKIVLRAYNDKLILSNPFHSYQLSLKKVDIDFLSMKEIKIIYKKEFTNSRLNKIKDVFIFSCLTGIVDKKRRKEKEGNRLIVRNVVR